MVKSATKSKPAKPLTLIFALLQEMRALRLQVISSSSTRFFHCQSSRLQNRVLAGRQANSAVSGRILISMRTRNHLCAFVLGIAAVFATPLLLSQQGSQPASQPQSSSSQTAKQDLKTAGRQSKSAVKNAGHSVKKGSKSAYHSTKKGTSKAWNKTKNTTKGAVDGGKAGAKQPDQSH